MGQEGSHLRSRLPSLLLISGSAVNILGNSTLRIWRYGKGGIISGVQDSGAGHGVRISTL